MLAGLAVFSLIVVGIICVIWVRHEKRVGEQLDKERAELEKQLLEEEQKKAQLEKERLAKVKFETNTYLREQGYKPSITIKKTEEINVVNEKPSRVIQPTRSTPTYKPRSTSPSVSSTPKATPKTTSRSSYRRDDDDYNNSTVLGSTWGSPDNDSRGGDSCGRSDGGWGSDSSPSSISSNDIGSWCD